jgi:hypothetical protein
VGASRVWTMGDALRDGRIQALTIGSKVACLDGDCGDLDGVVVDVVDPADRTVTHVVVEPGRRRGSGRLVPIQLVDSTTDVVHLGCTTSEFRALPAAVEGARRVRSDDALYGQGAELVGGGGPSALHGPRKLTLSDLPEGAVAIRRGERARATDGDFGRVRGITMDTGDHRLTHVVLDEGHLWGQKTRVAIAISAVKDITDADGVRLCVTKWQARDLPAPPADLGLPG